MNWYLQVLRKYAEFNGRARRTEYWMFALFSLIASAVLGFVETTAGIEPALSGIYGLAVLIPTLAVSVRRLHDTDRSGWWLLLGLVPVIGIIVLIVFAVLEGQPGPNRFGPNPKPAPPPA
jgi:uncharacterized membrane protein YhaH (DUF805 family)